MMDIVLNGKKHAVPDGATLAALLRESKITDTTDGIAVAVNASVVPRRRWEEVHLRAGDTVEVIHAVQGG